METAVEEKIEASPKQQFAHWDEKLKYAEDLVSKDNLAEATVLYKELVEEKQDSRVLGHLFTLLQRQGNIKESLDYLKRAVDQTRKELESSPTSTKLLTRLALLLSKQGNIADSISYYKKVLELDPKDEYAMGTLVNLLSKEKNVADIVNILQHNIGFLKKDKRQRTWLNNLKQNAKKTEKDPVLVAKVANISSRLGNQIEALECYTYGVYLACKDQENKSEIVEAIKLLKYLLYKNPVNFFTFLANAIAQKHKVVIGLLVPSSFFRSSKKTQTLDQTQVNVEGDNLTFKEHCQIANSFLKEQKISEAIDHYMLAAAEKPKDIKVLTNLGKYLYKEERFEEALQYIQTAVKLDPNNDSFLLLLSNTLVRLDRREEGLRYLDKIAELCPDNKGMVGCRERLRQSLGHFNEAEVKKREFSHDYFHEHMPTFSEEGQNILKQLDERCYAISHVDKLFNEEQKELWNDTLAFITEMHNSEIIQDRINRMEHSDEFVDKKKPRSHESKECYLLTHRHYLQRELKVDDIPLKLLTIPPILNIANAYHDRLTKLRGASIWINKPTQMTRDDIRIASQQWHRDQDDLRIIKCFIYFSDVTEESGALEYIPESIPGYKYAHVWPSPFSTGYPTAGRVERLVPKEDMISCCGSKGTIVFVNTCGFHRGGFVKQGDRRLVQGTYISDVSPNVAGGAPVPPTEEELDALPFEVKYAVTQ